MILLAIDVGNTRIKYAVFEKDNLLKYGVLSRVNFREDLSEISKKFQSISNLILSSDGFITNTDLDFVKKTFKTHIVSHDDEFPFVNCYATPHTLGIDRMILVAGAVLQFPKANRLVIDVGTCITYDFVNQYDNYFGGAISPGLRLRYEVLHHFTEKLPLLTLKRVENFIGNDTYESIHSGIVYGITHEINGFIEQYQDQFGDLIVILTGGDAVFLASSLKNTIFVDSNFLLQSLGKLYYRN